MALLILEAFKLYYTKKHLDTCVAMMG
jgi:hypothetical protein